MRGCSWVTAVLSCEVLARLMTEVLRVLVCHRVNDCSGLPNCITRNCAVFSDRQFTVRGMLIVLCELEFS